MAFFRSHILVSVDPVCLEKGAHEIIDTLTDELVKQGLIDEVQVLETSRIGDPDALGPDLMVYPEGVHYVNLSPADIPYVVEEHFLKGRTIEKFLADEHKVTDEEVAPPKPKEIRIVLRNSLGKIDPLNIEDYIAEDGYAAAAKALSEMTPEDVIETVLKSRSARSWWCGFPHRKKMAVCPEFTRRGQISDLQCR